MREMLTRTALACLRGGVTVLVTLPVICSSRRFQVTSTSRWRHFVAFFTQSRGLSLRVQQIT